MFGALLGRAQLGQAVPSGYGNTGSMQLPMDLLLSLINALPPDSPEHQQILQYIRDYAALNPKSHECLALVVDPAGQLVFDHAHYRRAILRGKQETRLKIAGEKFKELQEQLELLHVFHQDEQAMAKQLPPDAQTLLPLPDYSAQLDALIPFMDRLGAMSVAMANGLPVYAASNNHMSQSEPANPEQAV